MQGWSPDWNSRFMRLLAATAVAVAATAPSGHAATGTITFTGAITGNSCTVQVDGAGTGDGAVSLPVVDTAALGPDGSPQTFAAGTFFDISVSNCVSPETRVVAYFEAGPTVDPLTHALINSGTSNVGVKIYEASEASVVGEQVSPGVTAAAQALTGSGTWHFYAGYSPGPDEPRAGTVITSVTYSLVYL